MPTRHGGKTVLALLAAIVLVGLALRFNSALQPSHYPGKDAVGYQNAGALLYERGLTAEGQREYWPGLPPGLPATIAAVYAVTGGVHPAAARLFIALLGGVTILFAYLIGRRLGRGIPGRRLEPATGLVAAALVATYPYFIEYSNRFMTEPLAAFLVTAVVLALLWAADRSRSAIERGSVLQVAAPWAVPGVLIGLTSLTRAEYVVFGPIFALVALATVLFFMRGVRRRRRIGPASLAAGILAVTFAIPILPWTARNELVLGRFVPITVKSGSNLYKGTLLPGEGSHRGTKRFLLEKHRNLRLSEFRGKPITTRELSRTSMGRLLRREARDRYPGVEPDIALTSMARDNIGRYVRQAPLAYLKMFLNKAGAMWQRSASEAMWSPGWLGFQIAVLALAAGGLALLIRRRRWDAVPIVLLLLGVTAIGMATLAVPRRNAPLMPVTMALAALTVAWAGLHMWAWVGRLIAPGAWRRERRLGPDLPIDRGFPVAPAHRAALAGDETGEFDVLLTRASIGDPPNRNG